MDVETCAAIALRGAGGRRLTYKTVRWTKPDKWKKAKGYAKLSQKEKFRAAAKEFEADETGETFLKSFKTIANHKPKK